MSVIIQKLVSEQAAFACRRAVHIRRAGLGSIRQAAAIAEPSPAAALDVVAAVDAVHQDVARGALLPGQILSHLQHGCVVLPSRLGSRSGLDAVGAALVRRQLQNLLAGEAL